MNDSTVDSNNANNQASENAAASQNQTALLLLLDGILSQAQDRIQRSMEQIAQLMAQVNPHSHPTTAAGGPGGSATAASAMPVQQQQQQQQQQQTAHDGFLHVSQLPLPVPQLSVGRSVSNLCAVLEALLAHYPQMAAIPSRRDRSLPLHFAASLGSVHVARILMRTYPEAASTRNANNKIPLHYAAREGRTAMVEFLVSNQPHTAAIATSKHKLPVHFAAGDGHAAICQILLRAHPQGAVIPSKNKGKVALHFAARWGHLECARALQAVNPQGVQALDWEGSLPLHDAAREGQYEMSRYLVEQWPAALQTANLRGETPLFPAVRSGNVDLIVYFLQAWPMGAQDILKSVSADDHVPSWKWEIVELLLRGAVNNLVGCPLLADKEPPRVYLSTSAPPAAASLDPARNSTGEASSSNSTAHHHHRSSLEEMKKQQKKRRTSATGAAMEATVGFDPSQGDGGISLSIAMSSGSPAAAKTSDMPDGSTTTEDGKAVLVAPFRRRTTAAAVELFDESPYSLLPPAVSAAAEVHPPPQQELPRKPPVISRGSSREVVIPVPRSKSPILEAGATNPKKRALAHLSSADDSKRPRFRYEQHPEAGDAHYMLDNSTRFPQHHPQQSQTCRSFLALHAALECGASNHVIEYVLDQRPEQVKQIDDATGLTALHLVFSPSCQRQEELDADLVVNRILKPYPSAASQRDPSGRLPLHRAIEVCAHIRIISALLDAYPTAAIEACSPTESGDELSMPVYMACAANCDLSTVYALLRVDPSALDRPSR